MNYSKLDVLLLRDNAMPLNRAMELLKHAETDPALDQMIDELAPGSKARLAMIQSMKDIPLDGIFDNLQEDELDLLESAFDEDTSDNGGSEERPVTLGSNVRSTFEGQVVDYSLSAAADGKNKASSFTPPTLNSVSIENNVVRIYFDSQHCPSGRGRLRLYDVTDPSNPKELAKVTVSLNQDAAGNWAYRKELDTIEGLIQPKCPLMPVFELVDEKGTE